MLLITYVRGTVFLIFLITKTSSEQLAVYPLAGMFFILIFLNDHHLKFRIFIIRINILFNIITRLNINRLYFNCSMICIVVFIHYII